MPPSVQSIVRNLLRSAARRADGWRNVLTGIGTLSDKVEHTRPAAFRRISDTALTSLFHSDATSRKACELRPSAALRRGVTFTLPKNKGGAQLSTKMLDELERLDAINRFKHAACWENLFGGCLVWVGLDDGNYGVDSQELPVDMERVQRVLFLREIDRRYCYPELDLVETDPMSPNFGEPTHYTVHAGNGQLVSIHRDRLIVFPGATTSAELRQSWNGWGVSVLDVAWAALQRNGMVWGSAANAVSNSQYTVLKLAGFERMVFGKDGEEQAKKRAQAMEMAKSMINAILIGAEDEYIRENPNFGNLPEMIDRFMFDVAHALDVPVTKLFGRSPAGMNATGESDENHWHASVEEYQEHHLRMRFHRLCELIMAQSQGPFRGVDPGGWKVGFPALKQLSEVEKAEVRLKMAQGDEAYIHHGVATANEIALSRFREEGWSAETSIDRAARERLSKGDEETLQATAASAGGKKP